ncbi:PTS transporter subunit EIIC [Metabacillus bambusae]|uniref:PTS transporter subunit EIIC n=1 Tax=Metabacillus bambusae TaxID=2795218 RepID=A0ABS3N701_9BACI|nr:PTS transporter subunit EIIC [Metabacillus bambusae]MBO1514071.1 PTS transporter subunit EIIC [Metabacillus bambusae]
MNAIQISDEIVKEMGGKENIEEIILCTSRIRLKANDLSIVHLDELKKIEKVYGAIIRSEWIELILGKDVSMQVHQEINLAIDTSNNNKDKERGKGMFNQMFSKFQKFGKAIMLPIAVLPAAGLLLGIGGAFSNPNTIAMYPFLDLVWLQAIFTIMSSAGQVIFSNLPIIFAIGIAVGLAKTDKGVAGLAALLSYLVMNATLNAVLKISGKIAETNLGDAGQAMILGIQTLQTGVFGGVLSGLLTYILHKKFGKVQLPQFLGFFSGSRFIPIITSVISVLLGIALFYIWPPIQSGIAGLGDLVDKTGYFGSFIFGFILKLLGPLGLHHIFYLPFWQTGLGGTLTVDGNVIQGAQNIFFAQLGDPNVEQFDTVVARFMGGKYLTMMFGLMGAALAMYHTAKPENKKKVGGLLFTAALTSFLTGITEPLEFLFLFIAPTLFVIHAAFWGLAYMTAHIFNLTIGMTFSAGLIDFTLFGILQGNDKTNWILVPVIGLVFFVLYYVIFRTLIVKFNYKTPGREDEQEEVSADVNGNERGVSILSALGGKANVSEVDNCATRLRVTVNNAEMVSEKDLKKTGAKGVVIRGNGVQVIYGPHVSIIKTEIEEIMESSPAS